MVMCWVPHCKHYNNREICRFYSFPKPGTKERLMWLQLIRREGEPGIGACVCSCHFRNGLRENLPEIFEYNMGSDDLGEDYLSPKMKKPRVHKTELEDINSYRNSCHSDMTSRSTSKDEALIMLQNIITYCEEEKLTGAYSFPVQQVVNRVIAMTGKSRNTILRTRKELASDNNEDPQATTSRTIVKESITEDS